MIKAVAILVALNLGFAAWNPAVENLSVFNWLVPGEQRLPLSVVEDLEATVRAHEIAGAPRATDEFRVLLLGDSQTRAGHLPGPDTLGSQLNDASLSACGKHLRFFNLGYQFPSMLKDLLILNSALQYHPDAIVWSVTLDSFFPRPEPLGLVAQNPASSHKVLDRYGLAHYLYLIRPKPTFLEATFAGQAGRLQDLAELQLDGLVWAATDVDRTEDQPATARGLLANDLQPDLDWRGQQPPALDASGLLFDVLPATRSMIGEMPVLIVNEPIFIATGSHSDLRYNYQYPKWAFDQYSQLLKARTLQQGWRYLDYHSLVPSAEFTNSTLHLSSTGERLLVRSLEPEIVRLACGAQ